MKDVMISANDVKSALVSVKIKSQEDPGISDLTKAHILNYLYKALYEVIQLEQAASRSEPNRWLDSALGMAREENAEIH